MAAIVRRSPSNLSKISGTTNKSITAAPVSKPITTSTPTRTLNAGYGTQFLTTQEKNMITYSGGFSGGLGYGQALNNSEEAFKLGQQAVAATRAKLASAGLLSPLSVANQGVTAAATKIPTPKLGINKQPLKQVKNLSLAIQGFYK